MDPFSQSHEIYVTCLIQKHLQQQKKLTQLVVYWRKYSCTLILSPVSKKSEPELFSGFIVVDVFTNSNLLHCVDLIVGKMFTLCSCIMLGYCVC